jgi:hypothetical protein
MTMSDFHDAAMLSPVCDRHQLERDDSGRDGEARPSHDE